MESVRPNFYDKKIQIPNGQNPHLSLVHVGADIGIQVPKTKREKNINNYISPLLKLPRIKEVMLGVYKINIKSFIYSL